MSNDLVVLKKYANSPEVLDRFQAILGEHEARPYVESVILAVTGDTTGRLQTCDPASIMHSALRAATLRLSVDPAMHQAHMVAYGNKATLIPDYRGLVMLMENTGNYEHINVSPVYAGEVAKPDRFTGVVTITGEQVSDEIIGWVAYTKERNGMERYTYMSNEACDNHARKYNPNGFGKGAWKTSHDEMRRKTTLRCHCNKWGKYSPAVSRVLKAEDEIIDAEVEEMPEVSEATIQDVIEYGNGAESELAQNKVEAGFEEMTEEQKRQFNQERRANTLAQMGFIQ